MRCSPGRCASSARSAQSVSAPVGARRIGCVGLAPLQRDKSEWRRAWESARSARKRAVRGRTIGVREMSRRQFDAGRALFPPDDSIERPRTRGECEGIPRPCPFVSCVHHVYLDVSRKGGLKLNFPDLEPSDLHADRSCALDIADSDGVTLDVVGQALNISRERARQIELHAIAKMQVARDAGALRELAALPAMPGRHVPPIDEE